MKNPLKKAGAVARKVKRAVTPGPSTPLGEMTKQQLYDRARKLEIDGRSKMNKGQLVAAIRRAR